MGQLPQWHIIIVKDPVLFVIGDQIFSVEVSKEWLPDEIVIDDCGLDCFFLFFNLSLSLQSLADIKVHIA